MVSTDLRMANVQNGSLPTREYSRAPAIIDVPNLIQVQIDSFEHFKSEGLRELFDEISPIEDFPGGRFELSFSDHYFEPPKFSENECRERETTYAAALYVTVQLKIKAGLGGGEIKEQTLFIGDIPMMTKTGTFIINGAERVVVSQLVRSPGVYFTAPTDPNTGRPLAAAKLIPYRGAWMEFETSNRDVISVKVDRKRKTPVSTLLRCLGYYYESGYEGDDADEMRRLFETDEGLESLFADVDTNHDHEFIKTTIAKDTAALNRDDALLEFYRRLRPGEPPNVENAKSLIESLFFNPRRYDLGRVGRYKLNRKLRPEGDAEGHGGDVLTLTPDDIMRLLRRMIQINNEEVAPDDIDHLGNRRVRAVGELIQNQVRVGLVRMERVIKERMTTQMDPATTTPAALINIRPVVASVREFFGGSQLSQFMDQTNPLSELTHKRRLSALGPGGLSRERAGFEVRDVHHSHYGRICPIETPEGPNIGLLGSLAAYARTNEYGFIETPYRKVRNEILNTDPGLAGRELTEDVQDDSGSTILKAGGKPSRSNGRLAQIAALSERSVAVRPYVSDSEDDIVYLAADAEESVHIAQAQAELDELGQFAGERVETRLGEGVVMVAPEGVEYMDVAPIQLVSVSTALIPFLEHDDANRALMGSNMQRQAVPLLRPEPPLVGTGVEERVAKDSGQVVISDVNGVVASINTVEGYGGEVGYKVVVAVENGGGRREFDLLKFVRSNQGTCLNQRPIVEAGDVVKVGDVIADSSSTGGGELALGQNVLVAFMSWEGYNFEDAIIISRRLVKDDKFTSIHIEKHEVESRDTKLGAEEITRDIPNVGDESLRNLDEEGIIRVGAEINPGDILVGKITPKGETELSAEEKLLRAIFGEKARDVKDTSLRVPHGERGKIIDVKALSRDNGDELPPGVNKLVRLWVAQTRKITEGDKMAGRHGNKGVIARILPEEDMPFLPDGTPVDIILTPLGVPSRMNLGQVLETHLGWAASLLGFKAVTPVFDGAKDVEIEDSLGLAWIVEQSGAVDPRTRAEYDAPPAINGDRVREWLASESRGYDYDGVFGASANPGEARISALDLWFDEERGAGWGDCTELDYLNLELGKFLIQEKERFLQKKRVELKGLGLSPRKRKELEREASGQWDEKTKPKKIERWRQDFKPKLVESWNAMTDAERSELSAKLTEDGMLQESISLNRKRVAAPTMGKSILYDGRSGEPFDQPITVGQIYMMKLVHLVEDKIHARSTGPYSLITQQPLGGKAQFGGQRFGEMEVWALEAYSAAYNLQEMLTVKSDDVVGRVKTYEAIVKGEDVIQPGIPESFHVLLKELQSLGLAVELRYEDLEEMGLGDLEDGFGDEFGETLPPYDIMGGMDFPDSETAAVAPGEIVIDAEARPFDDGDGDANGNVQRPDFAVPETVSDFSDDD